MAFSTGALIGPYEILGALGSGGMGEVYRARDTRLGRTVAIKILPSTDNDLKARFAREARAIATLSHPHICTLYDVGQQDGTDYLVMEVLDGETLAARLTRGPLPARDVLKHAIEIAAALAAAHRAGIVHRDLKPANIMLTSSGAKLLDFGVAKLRPTSGPPLSGITATVSGSLLTARGVIVGTPQYMAPEQLDGKEVDSRSDLFAFGAILYEMITGQRAFGGTTAASVIAAIMSSEPPLDQLRTSPELEHVVRTCLLKNPDERRQSAHDVRLELEWVAGRPSLGTDSMRPRRVRWLWLASAALVLATAGVTRFISNRETPSPPMRVTIVSPGPEPTESFAVISPDGSRIAFAAQGPALQPVLWIRPLESEAAVAIPGTDGAYLPFWSPDGRSVGFFAHGKLKTVAADLRTAAPPVQTLADAPIPRGGTWSQDGRIVFARNIEDGLYAVPASGGDVTTVTTLRRDRKENSHRWPQFLPDGRQLLYLARSADTSHQGIYVGTPGSNDWRLLLRTPVSAMVAAPLRTSGLRVGAWPDAYLLFVRDQTLMAQVFDPGHLQLHGDAFPIAQSVAIITNRALFSVSNNSSLVYRPGTSSPARLVRFDRHGNRLPGDADRSGSYPRISPDGKQVAFVTLDPGTATGDIWIEDVARGSASRLTSHQAFEWIPVWAPQGDRVAFASNRDGVMDLYEQAIGAPEPERLLLKSDQRKLPTAWSADGKFMLFQQETAGRGWDLWALALEGELRALPLLQSPFNETEGSLSPDGKWLAYTSDETGEPQVYLRPFTRGATGSAELAVGKSRRLSIDGGSQPHWRSDGTELFYMGADQKIMSLSHHSGPPFDAIKATPLFEVTPFRSAGAQYDVDADGKRFIVALPPADATRPSLTLLLNWTRVAPK